MADDSKQGLFNDLEVFGFDHLSEISLFEKEEPSERKVVVKKPEAPVSDPMKNVFERKLVCPVCRRNIQVPQVKWAAIRPLSRDSDFMTYYQEPNPTFYEAWLCRSCGYCALSSQFNHISDQQRALIIKNITVKWSYNKPYSLIIDVDTATELHKLALLNAAIKLAANSEKAFICLRIAWLLRLKSDYENEKKYLANAVQGFELAHINESLPIFGLDEGSLPYLIGELHFRLQDYDKAMFWFGKVISNRNIKSKIKDMAKDQRQKIKLEMESCVIKNP